MEPSTDEEGLPYQVYGQLIHFTGGEAHEQKYKKTSESVVYEKMKSSFSDPIFLAK